MLKEFKRGILFTVVTMVLLGFGYHLVLWGFGRVFFPSQADGSLIRRGDGTIVGSGLIAQKFARNEYFHPRPSAVDYNAASTGASNFGPSNPDHLKAVRERLDAETKLEGVKPEEMPSEMVTTSGGGLDPHIPPNAAELQVARVARARKRRRGADPGSRPRAHREADARLPRSRPRQRARAEPGAGPGAWREIEVRSERQR